MSIYSNITDYFKNFKDTKQRMLLYVKYFVLFILGENKKLFVFAAFLYEQSTVLRVLDNFVLGCGRYKILNKNCTKLKRQSLTDRHSD